MNDRVPYATPILCFVAGGIAGATAALLLAPQSGRATRESMARRVGKSADSVREMKDRVLQKGGEVWEETAARVGDAAAALAGADGNKQGAKADKKASL
jgi:gas vesicle protein